jgi:hypothetical protein
MGHSGAGGKMIHKKSQKQKISLHCPFKDMAMRRIFLGFCRNWFLMSLLHYLSGRSDFGFEFAEIFVFEK